MKAQPASPGKAIPIHIVKLAWRWYVPARRAEILKDFPTERDLTIATVRALKSSLAPQGCALSLKDEYPSMRDFFRDAVGSILLFASAGDLHVLHPENTIYEGIQLMAEKNIRRIPVVNHANVLKGICTVRDIIRLLARTEKYEALYREEHNDLDLLLSQSVERIAHHNPVTLTRNHSVLDAVKLMVEHDIGGIPIVHENTLIGIITERDILYLAPLLKDLSGTEGVFIPAKNVVTIASDASIADAAKIMARGNYRRLPVMDQGRVTGIITTTDIIQAYYSLSSLFSVALSAPVKDIMIKDMWSITPQDPLDVAVNLMCRRNIGSLLVMEDAELRGVITERDVLRYVHALGNDRAPGFPNR